MDPWNVPLVTVGRMDGGERRSLSRDAERGLFHRVRQGVWVDAATWRSATGWEGLRARHILAMRAWAAVAPRPPIFSHLSAAVARGLPTVGQRFDRVDVTVQDERERGIQGVSGRLFRLHESEVAQVGDLLVTTVARTVVDVAGLARFDGGVMAADTALYSGLPREMLEAAADLAGPRRASRRIGRVIRFAHPGAESAAESEMRCSMLSIGIAPQQLQYEVWEGGRLVAVVDSYDDARRIACEADGDVKYLDPTMAPDGAGPALVKEKRREDLLRMSVSGLARFGYAEASDPARLRPILARVGLMPERNAPTLDDWAAVARSARPRRRAFVPERPPIARPFAAEPRRG
jgi:hypothetical protein